MSYGGIGVVIGHELTHGFDDQGNITSQAHSANKSRVYKLGQQYDANGNRKEWWTEESQKEFQKRTVCFEKQYSSYSLDGQMVHNVVNYEHNVRHKSSPSDC